MFSYSIVKYLNILKDTAPGLSSRQVPFMIHKFSLECFKKALSYSIIITVALTAHTLNEPISIQQLSELGTGILDTTIRMEDHAWSGFACSQIVPYRWNGRLFGSHRSAHGPPYDLFMEQIHDSCQI